MLINTLCVHFKGVSITKILCASIVLCLYLLTTPGSPVLAATGYYSNEYASKKYTQWFYPNCTIEKVTDSKVHIALINPTFTAAAYNHAFYDFYKKYDYSLSNGLMRNVTSNLNLLTGKVSNATIHTPENTFIKVIPQHIQKLLSGKLDLCVLTDQDLQKGGAIPTQPILNRLNNTDILHKFFDIVILFHEEYVTPKIYYMLKEFVSHGGTLIIASGNTLYAQVRYNENKNTVTLVNGHGWAFNNKTAFKGLPERWANETQKWEGSNFYRFALPQYLIRFYNYPFNGTANGPELNYISNKNAKIILDYNSSDLRYPIAAYQLDYFRGKVISIGVGSTVIRSANFLKFFDDLLINYANPKNVSITHHIPHFFSPYYKPHLSAINKNGLMFSSNQSDEIRLGSVINGTSRENIFRIIGKTGNSSASFLTQPLHYRGDTIKLTIGDVLKYGNSSRYIKYDNPVMLVFDVRGNKSDYKVTFVQGSFWKGGWAGGGRAGENTKYRDTYYIKMNGRNTSYVNLNDLLKGRNDIYMEVSKMRILLPKYTVVNPFDFQTNIIVN